MRIEIVTEQQAEKCKIKTVLVQFSNFYDLSAYLVEADG